MSLKLPKILSNFNKEEFQEWLDSFDVVLFDCDGVIWMFCEILEEYKGSNLVVNRLKELQKKIYFVSNNAMIDRKSVAETAKKLDFNIGVENVINPTFVAAEYLKKQNFDKTAYVIGFEGLSNDLNLAGIKSYGVGPDIASSIEFYRDVKQDPDVQAVIVSFDYHLSISKLTKAASFLINNPDCQLIGLETEKVVEPHPNVFVPLAGSIIKVLEEATKKEATFVTKPSDVLANFLFEFEVNIDKKRFLMVGDTLRSDIYFGKKYGMQTLLVGTGVNQMKDVEEILGKQDVGELDVESSYLIPDYYIDRISDLFKVLS